MAIQICPSAWSEMSVNACSSDQYCNKVSLSSQPMTAIQLEGLSKDYGDVLAADDLTFSVETGEIFGYLGPNGAGKTTTIRMLLGFISPTAGSATVLGHDIRDRRALVEAKRRIGYLSDEPGFDESATGEAILDLHASVKGDERRAELLDLFEPPLDRQIRDYSRGNVQKLGLVTTFMHDPDLVILDEPTSGLDPVLGQTINDLVVRVNRELELTCILITHDIPAAFRISDKVAFLHEGEVIAQGPPREVARSEHDMVRQFVENSFSSQEV